MAMVKADMDGAMVGVQGGVDITGIQACKRIKNFTRLA